MSEYKIFCHGCKNVIRVSNSYDLITMCRTCANQLQADLAFLVEMIPFAFDGGIVGTPKDHERYDTIKSRYKI